MSASELLRRTIAVFDERIEDSAFKALSIQYFAVRPGKGESVLPPTTVEDIALIVLEANAFRRGVEAAKNALIEEHRKLIAPDEVPSELGEENTSGEEPPFYQ